MPCQRFTCSKRRDQARQERLDGCKVSVAMRSQDCDARGDLGWVADWIGEIQVESDKSSFFLHANGVDLIIGGRRQTLGWDCAGIVPSFSKQFLASDAQILVKFETHAVTRLSSMAPQRIAPVTSLLRRPSRRQCRSLQCRGTPQGCPLRSGLRRSSQRSTRPRSDGHGCMDARRNAGGRSKSVRGVPPVSFVQHTAS